MEEQAVKMSALHFYPKRIRSFGLLALGFSVSLSIPFLYLLYNSDRPLFLSRELRGEEKVSAPLSFSLGLNDQGVVFPIPKIQDEISCSFDPPSPSGVRKEHLLVRIKKGLESKRVTLPCRVDLEFQKDRLKFVKGKSSFWVELEKVAGKSIEARWFVSLLDGKRIESAPFTIAIEETPVRAATEFAEKSPFRILAESKWLGQDLLRKEEAGERIEVIAGECLELAEGSWLVWKGQKWEKGALEKGVPIARIENVSGKGLFLEGWDLEGHVRLYLPPAPPAPFKVKPEELFTSLRIRSEKQISCVLEKQCMILKAGDWVLKTGGRWRILRKKEEREAFLRGKLLGELFIFEQICQKQGQKMIQGRIFNPSRTQVAPVELAAQTTRASEKRAARGVKR